MLFLNTMNKWLEDFTINDGGASFSGGERYELQGRVFEAWDRCSPLCCSVSASDWPSNAYYT